MSEGCRRSRVTITLGRSGQVRLFIHPTVPIVACFLVEWNVAKNRFSTFVIRIKKKKVNVEKCVSSFDIAFADGGKSRWK